MGGLVAGSILSLGVSAVHRKADDLYPLAPRRIPVVLALEVSTSWPSSAPQELASADLHHGKRESELGRTADCRRAIAEAEVTGGPKDGGKYLRQAGHPRPPRSQRWATFVRNHANAIIACDFFTSVTATSQVLYVFVANRDRFASHSALQYHGSSDGRVGPPWSAWRRYFAFSRAS